MSTLFISYRREDSSGYAINLYDRLANRFGRDHVFMDIDQIQPGEDFHDVIHEKLKSVQVAVVLIGKHWLNIPGETGRRLDNADDWVRLEIGTLLERKIRVIPVLVGGATMPKSTELPECLKLLVRIQAHEISDNRFRSDVDRLIQALEKIVNVQPSPQRTASSTSSDSTNPKTEAKGRSHKSSNRFAIGTGIVALLFGATALYNDLLSNTAETTPIADQKVDARLPFEPEMVSIPAGKFMMGSPESEKDRHSDEGPQHKVTIEAFEMSRFEITTKQFRQFVQDRNYQTAKQNYFGCRDDVNDDSEQQQLEPNWQNPGFAQSDDHPVVCVSWSDAQAYVKWLSEQTGKQYRLPTEAEWEYAARAGSKTRYWWGDDIGRNNAVCNGCGSQWDGKRTAPVGSFKANAFGLHDTAGNVHEWVEDCFRPGHDYKGAPIDGSAWTWTGPGDCRYFAFRGGSWNNVPKRLRSSRRDGSLFGIARNLVGFRIARDF